MKDYLILTDTRQQKENHIIKEFDKQNILHIRTTLPSADYMVLRYDEKKGMFLDYSILIDTKKDLEEIVGNLCNSKSHERIKREINRAKELGCKRFIFLIQDDKIKSVEDIKNWSSTHTKVRGDVLLKIMTTMRMKYGVEFIIVPKAKMASYIIKFLKGL